MGDKLYFMINRMCHCQQKTIVISNFSLSLHSVPLNQVLLQLSQREVTFNTSCNI